VMRREARIAPPPVLDYIGSNKDLYWTGGDGSEIV
jgi:hypothetical protein